MRDLLLFLFCCALAVGFLVNGSRRSAQREATLQRELYQLGAPQTMEDSAERSLLTGRFMDGLRATPIPATYQKLAGAYLVSEDLEGRQVLAWAVSDSLMGRVLGKTLEFFDNEGRPLKPKLWKLGPQVTSLDKPGFELAAEASLVADGPWLLYRDAKRWVAFRVEGGSLSGYLSTVELIIDGDTVTADKDKSWTWTGGKLEATVKS